MMDKKTTLKIAIDGPGGAGKSTLAKGLAKKLDLPVIVHDREAHADCLELILKHRPRGVMHCFSGSVETAKQLTDIGFYIGLGGSVTFKNARKPQEVAASVDISRLLRILLRQREKLQSQTSIHS